MKRRQRNFFTQNLDSELSLFRGFPDVHTLNVLTRKEKHFQKQLALEMENALSFPLEVTRMCLQYAVLPIPKVPQFLSHATEEEKHFFEEWVTWYSTKSVKQLTLRESLLLIQKHFADEKDQGNLDPIFESVSLGEECEDEATETSTFQFFFDENFKEDKVFRFGLRTTDHEVSFLVTHNDDAFWVHSEENAENEKDIWLTAPTVKGLIVAWQEQAKKSTTNAHVQFLQTQTKEFLTLCAQRLRHIRQTCLALSSTWESKSDKEKVTEFTAWTAEISKLGEDVIQRQQSFRLWEDDSEEEEDIE